MLSHAARLRLRLVLFILALVFILRRLWIRLSRPRLTTAQLSAAKSAETTLALGDVEVARRSRQQQQQQQEVEQTRPPMLDVSMRNSLASVDSPRTPSHFRRMATSEPLQMANLASIAPQQVKLQVSITRIKLRNLAPLSSGGALASLRRLFWSAAPPPALRVSLRWGECETMHTGALEYPQPGETPVWPDRFVFEHVTAADSITSQSLELALHGVGAGPQSAASSSSAAGDGGGGKGRSGRGGGASATSNGGRREGSSQAIGQVVLPLETVACGPTRNDHFLSFPLPRADSSVSSSTEPGARLAFRCRVSELRQWRIQLEKVKLKIQPDMLEPGGAAANAGRCFVFSLSYIFTSGSTDQSSHETEWHAPSSQLRVVSPGSELELEWGATPQPHSREGSECSFGTSLGGEETSNHTSRDVSRDGSPRPSNPSSQSASTRSSVKASPLPSPRESPASERAMLGSRTPARASTERLQAARAASVLAAASVARTGSAPPQLLEQVSLLPELGPSPVSLVSPPAPAAGAPGAALLGGGGEEGEEG